MAIKVSSKCNGISDKEWINYLLYRDSSTNVYSGWKSKEINSEYTKYREAKSNKIFTVFSNIDSISEGEHSDSAFDEKTILTISSIDSLVKGFKCNKLKMVSKNSLSEYVILDSNIYINGNTVLLESYYESPFYSISSKATSIIEKKVDSQVVQSPALNLSNIKGSEIYKIVFKAPEFEGGVNGWIKYCNANARTELGCKYIKIPKGQKSAMQTVTVLFAIDSVGNIVKCVSSKDEGVHPKLVKEALRLLDKSPTWLNGYYKGSPIPFIFKEKIVFLCVDE